MHHDHRARDTRRPTRADQSSVIASLAPFVCHNLLYHVERSINLYKLETKGLFEAFELLVGDGPLLGPSDIGESGDNLAAVIFVGLGT